jgi:hypothetical protein
MYSDLCLVSRTEAARIKTELASEVGSSDGELPL